MLLTLMKNSIGIITWGGEWGVNKVNILLLIYSQIAVMIYWRR